VQKAGKNAFVNAQGQPISDYIFDGVAYWTAEKAWVRHQGAWKVYHLTNRQFEGNPIERFEILRKYRDEIVVKTFKNGEQGLMSNIWGQLAPEDYSYIANVGTLERPIYLAERYLGQVELYVLLHLDEQGHLLKQQTIKKDDYERIACRE
jgi:hypothetical protein